ncbi:MAG: oxygenase MpaB family protein [Polyangiaceae bacterium]
MTSPHPPDERAEGAPLSPGASAHSSDERAEVSRGTSHPKRFENLQAARATFGPQVDRVGAMLSRMDPLADAVVEAFAHMPPGAGMKLLDDALRSGIGAVSGAPPELRELFREIDDVPAWVDQRALDRGGELLYRSGWFGGLVLGLSLLYGYASPGGNKPLVYSGRLKEQAGRRLAETSRFVQATTAPGGLERFSPGFAITIKVRLVHAQVRRMILASGRWDSATWGAPINQHDMAGTTLLFSFAPIESLRALGFIVEEEEEHLFMQLWRYSGYLMGVRQEILPTSFLDAARLKDIIRATEGIPDDDARRLTAALFAAGPRSKGRTPEERRRSVRQAELGEGLVRAVMGDELSDHLGIPKTRYRFAIHPIRAMVSRLERSRLVKRALRTTMIRSGEGYWRLAVSNAEHAIFAIPTELLGLSSAA